MRRGDRGPAYKVESIVLWNTDFYGTSFTTNAWIQLTFPKRYIFPTAYSLRGSKGWVHAKSWNVYGIHEGDEEKGDSSWDLLGQNDSTQSPYCNQEAAECASNDVGTLTLKPMPSLQGYRSIRWMSTVDASSEHPTFMTSGVDVYGILTKSKFNDISTRNAIKFYMLRYSHKVSLFNQIALKL